MPFEVWIAALLCMIAGPASGGLASLLPATVASDSEKEYVVIEELVLADFADATEVDRWRVVNDGVMGGLSTSRLVSHSDSSAVFEGRLSLENNGGFASVRRAPDRFALEGAAGLVVTVRGDGRRYQLRLRTNDRLDGVAYTASFDTVSGEWMRVEIPIDAFRPTFRGRFVPSAPALVPADVRQLGLLLADKRPGPFRLEVRTIGARIGSRSITD